MSFRSIHRNAASASPALAQDQLCTAIRAHARQGLMRTVQPLLLARMWHHTWVFTFSHTPCCRKSGAKIREDALHKVCYIGCGVTTGIRRRHQYARWEAGANVVVFGLAHRPQCHPGARLVGGNKIIGVDLNPGATVAEKLGMTISSTPRVGVIWWRTWCAHDGGADYVSSASATSI